MSPLLEPTRPEVLQRIAPDLVRPLASVERAAIESAMILCEGNASMAAEKLGVSRDTLYRKLREYRKADA